MAFKLLKPKTLPARVFLTILTLGIAFTLRMILLPPTGRVIYSTFYPAIALIVLFAGFNFGMISMVLGGVLAYFFLLPPLNGFKSLDFEQGLGLVTYFVAASIICFALREVGERGKRIQAINKRLEDLMSTHAVGKTLEGLVEIIASTIEMRDPYTQGHQKRVSQLAVAIGKRLKLSDMTNMGIQLAGMILDLGKLGVPVEILNRSAALTPEEETLIRQHPQISYDALKNLEAPWPLADIILQHHERLDGTGYPNKLRGDQILIESRILAVADVVEAMTARRPYRESFSLEVALEEVKGGAGTRYDPIVVNACEELFRSNEFSWPKN